MIARRCVFLIVSWILMGCGAAEPGLQSIAATSNAPGTSATATAASSDGTKSNLVPAIDAEPDEKAAQAKLYCEHEIKKGEKSPFDLLGKKQISSCLIALRPSIRQKCSKGVKKQVILKIIVGKDGAVLGAFPVGEHSDSVEAGCVADQVKPTIFPKFTGKEQQVIDKYPFEIEP